MTLDLVALRKALSTEKTDAYLSYYCHGHIHYHFRYDGHCYEFPMETIDVKKDHIELSADLGTTAFRAIMPAREMWRWIVKAYKEERLVKTK